MLKEPLCLDDLSGLLNLRYGLENSLADMVQFVRQLRILLVVFGFITKTDLFKNISLDHRFCVDLVVAEAELALSCFERLADIIGEEKSGCSPESLQYASRFCHSHAEVVVGKTPGLVLRDRTGKVENLQSLFSAVRQSGSSTPNISRDFNTSPSFFPLAVAR